MGLMARESLKSKRERALFVAERLNERYPSSGEPERLLNGDTPFRFMVAVMLSAQTTDAGVNKVTPALWERYPRVEDLASANPDEVASIIHAIGFYRQKSQRAIECARMLLTDFGGEMPQTMEELQRFPGVGRKSANIVMNTCFGKCEGIAVDTHVLRISHLLRLSNAKDASGTEQDLLKVFPRETWPAINHQLVRFGREVCIARRPKCDECALAPVCPSDK